MSPSNLQDPIYATRAFPLNLGFLFASGRIPVTPFSQDASTAAVSLSKCIALILTRIFYAILIIHIVSGKRLTPSILNAPLLLTQESGIPFVLDFCISLSRYRPPRRCFSGNNKYPPAKPGVFHRRAKPYDTSHASRHVGAA